MLEATTFCGLGRILNDPSWWYIGISPRKRAASLDSSLTDQYIVCKVVPAKPSNNAHRMLHWARSYPGRLNASRLKDCTAGIITGDSDAAPSSFYDATKRSDSRTDCNVKGVILGIGAKITTSSQFVLATSSSKGC